MFVFTALLLLSTGIGPFAEGSVQDKEVRSPKFNDQNSLIRDAFLHQLLTNVGIRQEEVPQELLDWIDRLIERIFNMEDGNMELDEEGSQQLVELKNLIFTARELLYDFVTAPDFIPVTNELTANFLETMVRPLLRMVPVSELLEFMNIVAERPETFLLLQKFQRYNDQKVLDQVKDGDFLSGREIAEIFKDWLGDVPKLWEESDEL